MERFSGFDHHTGRAGDEIMRLEQAVRKRTYLEKGCRLIYAYYRLAKHEKALIFLMWLVRLNGGGEASLEAMFAFLAHATRAPDEMKLGTVMSLFLVYNFLHAVGTASAVLWLNWGFRHLPASNSW